MNTFLGTSFEVSALEGRLAISIRSVLKPTCKACIVSFQDVQDFLGRQLGDSTMFAKRIVLIVETLEEAGTARIVENILLSSNRFNINLGGWDNFLVLYGVVVVRLGHLGEVVGDEVEDVSCHSVLGILFSELLEALEEGLMGGDGDAVDDGVVEGGG